MITAGRLFLISPPIVGSKLTHHTSPRFICNVRDGGFCPFGCLRFAGLIGSHFSVTGFKIFLEYVWANKRFDELANFSSANYTVKSDIDLLIHGDSQFLFHTCSIRIAVLVCQAA